MLHRTMYQVLVRRLPPLGSIQAFVQVARLGSLKAAAESLALSSPALTRRIQALEQIAGTALVLRSSNGVRLNARGEQLLAEIEPHLDGLAAAFESIMRPSGTKRIRISAPSLFASQRLMPALPRFVERHPDVLVDVDAGANCISRLDAGLDVAIAVAETVDSGKYYARVIERGEIIAIGSPRLAEGPHAVRRPQDLAHAHVLLHREMPRAFEEWRNSVALPELTPTGITYYGTGQLILDAAAQGLGIAFLLDSHVGPDHGTMKRFFPQSVDSPYACWFVCNPAALQERAIRLFHDWLFDEFPVSAANLPGGHDEAYSVAGAS